MPKCKEGESSITVRCSVEEKEAITKKWKDAGFSTEAAYIRFVALNAKIEVKVSK